MGDDAAGMADRRSFCDGLKKSQVFGGSPCVPVYDSMMPNTETKVSKEGKQMNQRNRNTGNGPGAAKPAQAKEGK